jgi:hypothetical protein
LSSLVRRGSLGSPLDNAAWASVMTISSVSFLFAVSQRLFSKGALVVDSVF